jgi:hypothetical protein
MGGLVIGWAMHNYVHKGLIRGAMRALGPEATGLAIGIGCGFAGPWGILCSAGASYDAARAFGASTSEARKAAVTGAFSAAVSYGVSKYSVNLSYGEKVFINGMAGGITAELTGGKFGHGFVAAGSSAAIGPGLSKIESVTGRTIVAAIVGGTISEATGGKFANGAQTAAFLVLVVAAADYYQNHIGGRATLSPGKNRPEQSSYSFDKKTKQQAMGDRSMNVIGLNKDLEDKFWADFFKQSGPLSETMNLIPGMNSLARVHDYWLRPSDLGGIKFNFFTNIGLMIPAGVVSYSALFGQIFQPLSYQQLMNIAVSTSHDHDGKNAYDYLGSGG